jgi:hypothetical protein
MSQTLYEEAIAEARRLTEMAEQNAKNKIIDAVTPQIKRLIEAELLKGGEDHEEDDLDSEMHGDEESPEGSVIDLDALAADGPAPAAQTAPSASPAPLKGVTSFNTDPDGTIEIETDDLEIEIKPKEAEDVELTEAIASSPAARRRLRERIVALEGKVKVLKRAINEAQGSGTPSQKQRIANIFEQLAKEAVSLRGQAILTERKTGGRTLEANIINSIIKEMKHMSRRGNKNAFDFLFEADEDENKKPGAPDMGMDMPMDVTDSGAEDADAEVDDSAVADALKTLGSALGVDVTVAGGADEEEPMDMDLDLDEEEPAEEQSEEEESEEEESDEEEELEEMSYAGTDNMSETTYDVNESALRRELNRLRRINEADAVSGSGASSFGGGKAGDDMFVDVDEETLLNALADELGDAPKPKMGGTFLAKETRARGASLAEAAQLRRQVADYRNVAGQLKKQLVEMNLFNAKLLYANKLMQNRDLSAKQQRAIVEALDNAKTLREAKLLYKSLTTSLNKASNSGSLTEGRSPRILGSSSKSARSAQPNLVSEGVAGETDRWALLAGIKKD